MNMIPEFPKFKKIEIADKFSVEHFTKQYSPYSDFNFTSMWCWSGNNELELSHIGENLVVKFADYIFGKGFYSYLGTENVAETVEKLIEYSVENGLDPVLKLVPEDSVKGLDPSVFKVEESLDNFDYILDNQLLVDLKGQKLHNHAGFKRRFTEAHGNLLDATILNSCSGEHIKQFTKLAELWIQNKIRECKEVTPEKEFSALTKICEFDESIDNFKILIIFHDGKVIAFLIDELLDGDYAIRHFMKADTSYKGVYSYLVSEGSKILLESNRKYVNVEQDLGLPNLRQAKRSYRPVQFLKKYTVSKSG